VLLGLLADVHANHDALDAALEHMVAVGVEELVVAGDVTGYYYDTAQVIEALQRWNVAAVRGNHESHFRAWLSGQERDEYHQRYGSSLDVAGHELTDGQRDWLVSLPPVVNIERAGVRIAVCHAVPEDEQTYIYPDAPEQSLEHFSMDEADLWVVGHTHHPVVWRRGGGLVVNPGSIGQQRSRQPGAHWASYDTETGALVFRSTPYDTSRLERECLLRDPHVPYLRDVLRRF
jgi:putative phosphoesterase